MFKGNVFRFHLIGKATGEYYITWDVLEVTLKDMGVSLNRKLTDYLKSSEKYLHNAYYIILTISLAKHFW